MSSSAPLLTASGLGRTVNVNGKPLPIISDFNYDFLPGHIYTVIGPSGSGKSSHLIMLNRLDEPTGGNFRLEGSDFTDFQPTDLRRKVGYLFQTPYLFPGTIADNLLLATDTLSIDRQAELLSYTGLSKSMLNSDVTNLSGGERQRVALARLLACNPRVLLLDEPTSSLDPTATVEIENLIVDVTSRMNLTTIWVTHNPDQAERLGHETLLLVCGCLVESGPSEQVIGNPQTDEGRRYKRRELK
ncbi:MAG: ATP-binding cassette domain-containing protein [candidate division Zixibacteria bacterium]